MKMKLFIALTCFAAVAASAPKLRFKDENSLCIVSKSGTSITSDCDVSAPGASIVGNKALIDGIDTRLTALEAAVTNVVNALTAHKNVAVAWHTLLAAPHVATPGRIPTRPGVVISG